MYRTIFALMLALGGLILLPAAALAIPFNLTNGPGDGTVSVGVDGYGSFGLAIGANATDAFFDPVGAQGPTATTFESGVAISVDVGRQFLTSGSIGSSGGLANPMVSGVLPLLSTAS